MKAGNLQHRKGLWTAEEDRILIDYIREHGKGKWNRIARETGLKRCGKSCRLRWINYLSPSVKRGDFSEEEEDLIIRLHNLLGNRWSLIAGRVPGRTDNQVKNHWNTHLSKKLGIKKGKSKVVRMINDPQSFSGELAKNISIPSGTNLSQLPNKSNTTTTNINNNNDDDNNNNNDDDDNNNNHNHNNINNGEAAGDQVTKDGSQSAPLGFMSDNYESSFWFSSTDDYNHHVFNLNCSHLDDFIWDIIDL